VYSKAGGVRKQDEEVGYTGPATPDLIQINFEGAIQHAIAPLVPLAMIRKSSTTATMRKSSVRKSSSVSCKGPDNVVLGNKLNSQSKSEMTTTTKENKKKEMFVRKQIKDATSNTRQLPLKKKSTKKKGSSKNNPLIMHSKSSPGLSNEPMNIDTTIMFLKEKESENNDEPDPLLTNSAVLSMYECASSPIEKKKIIDIVAWKSKKRRKGREISKSIYALSAGLPLPLRSMHQ
jgi:hypothetical protein